MKKLFCAIVALIHSSQLISADINWSFPPDTISTVNVNASDPEVAIDSFGNVVAVWVENGIVKSKSKPHNMNWSSVSTLSGSSSSAPKVVSDQNGNSAAIWLEGSIVKAATKSLNGNWSNSTALSKSNAASPTLAVDSLGNLVAAWARNGDIEITVKLFGEPWQNRTSINSTGAAFPHVAIGGSSVSRAAIVWNGKSDGNEVVYSSTRLLPGSWSKAQIISNIRHKAGFAHAAVDQKGNVSAVWFKYDVEGSVYSNVTIQSAENRISDGNWDRPVSLSAPGNRNPATLTARISFDRSGNTIALWNTSFDNMTFSIQSAIKPAYMNWANPIDLLTGNLYAFDQGLSVASIGDAIAVYMFYNGSAQLIESTELDITGFMESVWSVPLNISTGTRNANPCLASSVIDNAINTAAVWISSDGIFNSVSASVGSKNLLAPPSGLTVSQSTSNFGTFTEYYNTLSWEPSVDPSVVAYLIYRNGQFLGRVDAGVSEFVDHNRAQNETVIYGVAAVDSQQSHSNVITTMFP